MAGRLLLVLLALALGLACGFGGWHVLHFESWVDDCIGTLYYSSLSLEFDAKGSPEEGVWARIPAVTVYILVGLLDFLWVMASFAINLGVFAAAPGLAVIGLIAAYERLTRKSTGRAFSACLIVAGIATMIGVSYTPFVDLGFELGEFIGALFMGGGSHRFMATLVFPAICVLVGCVGGLHAAPKPEPDHPTDDELIAQFREHRDALKEIADFVEKEKPAGFPANPDHGVGGDDPARKGCRELMTKAGIESVYAFEASASTPGFDGAYMVVSFRVDPVTSKGICQLRESPPLLDVLPTELDEGCVFRHVEDRWYLYFKRY